MKHVLSLESMDGASMREIVDGTTTIKSARGHESSQPLSGQTWAMLFSKSSTRTRVSFEVGLRELGANPLFLNGNDIQLGRGEPIEDTASVLGRMVHGVIIRTFAQRDVDIMAAYSGTPVVNALTDTEHPCQILADVFTIEEKRGPVGAQRIAFIGDGDCNVARSWMFAAKKLGFELRIGAPKAFFPTEEARAAAEAEGDSAGSIVYTEDPREAVDGVDVVYSDVWISMGKEAESEDRIRQLTGFQVNQSLLSAAKSDALVMHCLPAYRGMEIDEEVMSARYQAIMDQAENRLHAQKSILTWLVS